MAQKLGLFSDLAQILGIGAKTNVGYGAMTPTDETCIRVLTDPTPASISTIAAAPPVQLPEENDIGKCFTAKVVKSKDKNNYSLKVNHNGSTFYGMISKKLVPDPSKEIEVRLNEIAGKNYKFVLAQ